MPIALELARTGLAKVTLAVTEARIEQSVRTLAGADLGLCELVTLGLHTRTSRLLQRGLEGLIPARKLLVYRDNLEFFRGFDALVVAEKTSLLLKTRYGLDNLKIIHTRHGAGDRAIGFGKESARFDLVLVAGPKIERRLVADAGVDPARIRVVGYSKFDLCGANRRDLGFAQASRPTVLYNPHPSPRLSSWFTMGEALLEAFAASNEFNLVFAPHVMMFARRWTVTINPPAIRRMHPPAARFAEAPNIHVDLGSAASTDMTYTNSADIYIGDVSSQVYEFLYHPRPCLFLDAHQTAWENDPDYAHWKAGPVIGPGTDILAGVRNAIATRDRYLPVQRAMLADTFSVTDEPAALRGAKAIAQFLASSEA
nr:hypothetical protein [Novosphingobium profundi]